MTETEKEGELQQLVCTEEDHSTSGRFEVTPPVSPGISKNTQTSPTSPTSNKQDLSSYGGGSTRGVPSHASSSSRSISRVATAPSLGSSSTGTKLLQVNEKIPPQRPPRPAQPPASATARLKRGGVDDLEQHQTHHHHCFLSDVTDVRRMETALLTLLDDFHSGKLRAFGKDCSMEEMTAIREQQEKLARLHFELGATQDLFAPLSDEGLAQGRRNMSSLMASLEQLSESIEKLHSFSCSNSMSVPPPPPLPQSLSSSSAGNKEHHQHHTKSHSTSPS